MEFNRSKTTSRIATVSSHLIALAAALLSVPAMHAFNNHCAYRCGLDGQIWIQMPLPLLLEWCLVPAIYFIVHSIVMKLMGASDQTPRRWLPLIRLGSFVIGVVFFYATGSRPLLAFMDGFQANIKSRVTPDEIEALRPQLLAVRSGGEPVWSLERKDWPDWLDKLKHGSRPDAVLYFDASGKPDYLLILYGDKDMGYGICYSLVDQTPDVGDVLRLTRWTNNIYFFLKLR